MKTDIQIAQEAEMKSVKEVAGAYGIGEDELQERERLPPASGWQTR